ncbi:MAG: signal recognition particle protein [Eubacteriaceae bacterium]|nr:signal recognition particle protein [Eubacteriaceae bacterium]
MAGMFNQLGEKIQGAFKKLSGKGKLTEKDIDEALREIRMALLEADVNFKVVKSFLAEIKELSMGEEVQKSLTPGQQVIKIVNSQLTKLLGGKTTDLKLSGNPAVILLAGVQGSGKTTSAVKLAFFLKEKNKKVLLAACDTYRAAAVEQLRTLAQSVGVEVYSAEDDFSGGGVASTASTTSEPVQIAKAALSAAKARACDILIIDTAGRQHVDDILMEEITQIAKVSNPCEVLFVTDCMMGQSAVDSAKAFDEKLSVTGFILTKADSDSRGGAALSVSYITGKPIKFAGTGEKTENFEVFHPDRMAGRILGMGDMLTLIERAEKTADAESAMKLAKKLTKNEFTLEDYLEQMEQMEQMGGIGEILSGLPGAGIPGANKLKNLSASVDEKQLLHSKAIIQSMTPKERRDPNIINASRRRRIAAGSGLTVTDVNRLLNSFTQMKKMMKQFSGNKRKMRKNFPFM